MKNIRRGILNPTVMGLSCALVVMASVEAAPLTPSGGIIAPAEPAPVGASTVFSTNVTWSSVSSLFSGTLTSTVLTGDASNPLGGLTFTYQFTVDTGATHQGTAITIGGFSSFFTDVSFVLGTNTPPYTISRSATGQDIQFHFFPAPIGSGLVNPGAGSALLVVQTSAADWSASVASIINSSAVPNIATLAPVNVVPEPGVLTLAGFGLLYLSCLKRKRISKTRSM